MLGTIPLPWWIEAGAVLFIVVIAGLVIWGATALLSRN